VEEGVEFNEGLWWFNLCFHTIRKKSRRKPATLTCGVKVELPGRAENSYFLI